MQQSGKRLAAGVVLAGVGSLVSALTQAQAIYTCVDARGRKLTADRPIPECLDREQKLLNSSGAVKGKMGPSLTAQERAEQEARDNQAAEEQARLNEEKRRDRALLVRFPNKEAHDKERVEALAQINQVKQAAIQHVKDLLRQREVLDTEMEFYKKDPSRAPAALRRQVDANSQNMAAQGRFIAMRDGELNRVNARFDEELVRLRQLWSQQVPSGPVVTNKKR